MKLSSKGSCQLCWHLRYVHLYKCRILPYYHSIILANFIQVQTKIHALIFSAKSPCYSLPPIKYDHIFMSRWWSYYLVPVICDAPSLTRSVKRPVCSYSCKSLYIVSHQQSENLNTACMEMDRIHEGLVRALWVWICPVIVFIIGKQKPTIVHVSSRNNTYL